MYQESGNIQQIIEPVVTGMGYELWGYDFRTGSSNALLRVYIDNTQGISLDDCARVSHQLSGVLDVETPIQVPYTLEVSSPGLDRPLLKREHFMRFLGHKVKIRLKWPIGERRNFFGELEKLEGEQLILNCEQEQFTLPLNAIKQARLAPYET